MLAKVTRGNQVTIPKDIVKKANLKQGRDYVNVEYVDGVICLKPIDIEERISDETYERFIKKATRLEESGRPLFPKEAETFLKKRAKI